MYNPWYLFVDFQRGLYNASGTVSSKRVAGMFTLTVVLIMVLGSQFSQYKLDYAVLIALLGFVLACFGMNTALTAKAMNVKESVASEMVEGDNPGANKDAMDVLKADKP